MANSRPGRFSHGQQPRYPLNRRLDGPQRRSRHFGEEYEFLPLTGLEPPRLRSQTQLLCYCNQYCQYCIGLRIWATRQISRETEILGNVCGVCTRVTKPRKLPSANNTHLSTERSLGEQVFKTVSALAQPSACNDRVVLTLCHSLLSLSLLCACEVHPSVYWIRCIWCSYPRQKGRQNLSLTAGFHLVPRLRIHVYLYLLSIRL